MVVQATRLPSLNPQQALIGATKVEKILQSFPEVISVATRSGSPAVATDPMGLEQSDILVRLKPRDEWTSTHSQETLISMIAHRLAMEAPDAQYNFSQPIEMRFNEMLEGIKGDVGVKVYGPDLDILLENAHKIADILSQIEGVGDVVKPAIEGIPTWEIKLNDQALSLYGLKASDVLPWVEAVQRGLIGGEIIRHRMRENIVIKIDLKQLGQLKNLPIPLPSGNTLPLGEIAQIEQIWVPTTVDRHQGSRRMVVECNVRGRDIGSFVQEAQSKISALKLPNGYWIEWSGKYEQLQDATKSFAVLMPVVLIMIVMILYIAFHRWKPTILIFLNVPVALFGGLLILWLRDMPLSISAMIGCIALFGVAVMNGIVMLSRTQELHHIHLGFEAAYLSAQERLRPVLTTALVAGLGFVPMAIAQGVGAEVQRPLATVVIGGLVSSTTLTLLILPALYAWIYRKQDTVLTDQDQI
jgi:cobalt-zinc-cadmium resistance protein CzcA